MAEPLRIQRRRTKGWRMQDASPNGLPVIYVGRPSRWGNPWGMMFNVDWMITSRIERARAVKLYSHYIRSQPDFESLIKKELHGKNLACWCPIHDENGKRVPCHADVLLEMANA